MQSFQYTSSTLFFLPTPKFIFCRPTKPDEKNGTGRPDLRQGATVQYHELPIMFVHANYNNTLFTITDHNGKLSSPFLFRLHQIIKHYQGLMFPFLYLTSDITLNDLVAKLTLPMFVLFSPLLLETR